jgi:PAS domain S-box-containing protein
MSRLKWSLGPLPTACFSLVLSILIFNCVVVHRNTLALHSTHETIGRLYERLMRFQALLLSLRGAEADARGYIMSGDNDFLTDYQQLATTVPETLRLLRETVLQNRGQAESLAELAANVNSELVKLEAATSKRTRAGPVGNTNPLADNGVTEELYQIRKLIDRLRADDTRVLNDQWGDLDRSHYILLAANLIAVVIGAAIIVLAWYLVERELRMRRSAEATAHLERQNLLVTLTSIGEGVIVVDAQGRVKLVNPVAMQLIGHPQVVMGRSLSNVFPIVDEATHEPVQSPVSQVLARGRISDSPARTLLIRPDGIEIPIEQNASPIHDSAGRIIGVVFVFRDCSERLRFEREMRERERRFRRVFDTPLIGIAVGTTRGEILEANDAFLDLLGYDREQFREMALIWDGVPHGQGPLDDDAQQELRQNGVCRPFERAYTRMDGTRVPVLISAARLMDDQDQIVVFVTDLSQSKKTEAALRESEARFRVLSECMPQMVWTARPDGRFDYFNRIFLEYAGFHRDQLTEWSWTNLIHPDDVGLHSEKWNRSLASSDMFEMELRVLNNHGEYRWHLSRALPVFRGDGQITMWVGTNTDIHDQKQAEESLREEHHRKDKFLALLAHELRNPLAPLSNAIQVFQSTRVDPENSASLLGIMQRQIRHLTRLIDDLLDLARITTGRMRLRREPIVAKSVVDAAVEAVQPLMTERRHELSVCVPDEELWLDADSARLTQVLTNLLHNAAKYTDAGGKLDLTVQRQRASVCFRVSDNGAGISPVMLPKIFDLFMQAELTLNRAHGGLGVGLTLVRTLVEMHGGTVSAFSEGVGRGSVFVIQLPILESSNVPVPETDGEGAAREVDSILPALRILVVDDVQASAKTLALMLNALGQNVEVAFDGVTALDRVAKTTFDLLFIDIAMPDIDGLEVARRIRTRPERSSLTLIALTGFGQEIDRAHSLQAGFNEHLTKPTSLDSLRHIIQRIVDSRVETVASTSL